MITVPFERAQHPTPAQLLAFRAYVETGSQKIAANRCGISPQTLKNHLHDLYQRLGVSGAMEAANKLGWVSFPDSTPKACGWIGYCTRSLNHRGHHGGMRAFDPNTSVEAQKWQMS